LLLLLSCPCFGYAQTGCVSAANLTVPTFQGRLSDIAGNPVSGAVVTLESNNGSQFKATTRANGQFRLDAPPGKYKLLAFYPSFQSISTTLTVGPNTTASQESTLYIILGLQGSYCSFITTSKKEFDNIIRANKKRLKESAQKNATQK